MDSGRRRRLLKKFPIRPQMGLLKKPAMTATGHRLPEGCVGQTYMSDISCDPDFHASRERAA